MDEISRIDAKTPIVKRSNSSLRIQKKKSSQPLKSPVDRILFLQRTIGNQAVQRMVQLGALQDASGLTGTLQSAASQNKTGMPDNLKSGLENNWKMIQCQFNHP